MSDEAKVKSVLARAEQLRSDRSTTDAHWEEIRELMYPSGASFTTKQTAGEKSHQKVFDSTGEMAVELLAAALHGMLTNPSVTWFSLKPAMEDAAQDDEEAAKWLENVRDRMMSVFNSPRANFAPQQHEKYMDLATYGSACMYIQDRPGSLPLFSTRSMSECYFSENSEGRVDTIYRWFEMTAIQAVQEFGDKAPEKIQKAAAEAKDADKKFKFIHAVYPRRDRDPSKADNRNMPFVSCWIGVDDKVLIREGGYEEFPFTCPRWSKRAGEVYGRGPGMKALADTKMLQTAMRTTIRGFQLATLPPLMVPDDGVMSPVRLTPAGLTSVRTDMLSGAGNPIRPIVTGARPDLGEEFLASVRKRIEGAFYTPLLQFARDPRMTATQVLQITEQTVQTLNPILGRLQTEDLGPMIDRLFGIMYRAGQFDPPPESLMDQELKVEYVSPIAKSQRIGEARGFAQTLEILAPMIQMDPSIMDNFDTDRIARDIPDLMGARATWLRGMDDVMAMRQAKQEVAAQAAQMQSVEMMAGAAKQGASAVNDLASAQAQGTA